MDGIWQDVRFGVRTLRKAPVFTLICVLTLAIGIGANTAIFSVINATLLRKLPYREPDRLALASLTVGRERGASVDTLPWSYPKFRTFLERQHAFASVAAFTDQNVNLVGTGDAERLTMEMVSATYFPLLGVRAIAGRTFLPEEDSTPGAHPVALLGHALWMRRFAGDPGVVGRTITIDKTPLTIVGVLPAGFKGLSGDADLWTPMMMASVFVYPEVLEERWNHWFEAIGRLRPGVTLAQARSDVAAAGAIVHEAHIPPQSSGGVGGAIAVPLLEARSDPVVRQSMLILLGAVGLVLLIACVNVANLLIARASGREREIAIRVALGAGRSRLVRQLLTESTLLAVAGGVLGVLFALWATELLSAIRPERTAAWGIRATELLDLGSIAVDGRVLGFAFLLSIATGAIFGLLPALTASRPSLVEPLKDAARGGARGFGTGGRLTGRGLLVAAELAMALVLLVGAGLLLRSFQARQGASFGFRPEHVLTLRVSPAVGDYDRVTAPAMHEAIIDRLEALPGVRAVSVDKCTPLSSACNASVVTRIDDTQLELDPAGGGIGVHFIAPGHLAAMGIPLLRGRAFTKQDRPGSPKVVLINEAAARKWWPGEDPIGRRIGVASAYFRDSTAEVVGVVGDVRYDAVEAPPRPDVYVPDFQFSSASTFFFVRTNGDPLAMVNAIRREIRAVDPSMPVYGVSTMTERIGDALSRSRFASLLLAIFAGVALVLSAVGIYGVMAYAVAQRTHEMGVRMALGAERADVLRLVLSQGARITALGVAVGLLLSLALTRVLSGLLYGVTPTDPPTFATIAVLLAASALFATYIPARRATRVDPMLALRHE